MLTAKMQGFKDFEYVFLNQSNIFIFIMEPPGCKSVFRLTMSNSNPKYMLYDQVTHQS